MLPPVYTGGSFYDILILMENNCGIYCYTNKINGKKYVGQSINLRTRRREMKYERSYAFYGALTKYGIENFDYEILEYCEVEQLNDRETFWIAHYQTFPPELGLGYNLTSGGLRCEVSDETRKKQSIVRKALNIVWTHGLKGDKNPRYGKPLSDEHKLVLSECHSGEKHWQFGKHVSKETSEKISNSLQGHHYNLYIKHSNSSSVYHGLTWNKSRDTWTVRIGRGKDLVYIGSSKDEETAARMYDAYVREHNLSHPLNFED
jgi:group I intron endonuclease